MIQQPTAGTDVHHLSYEDMLLGKSDMSFMRPNPIFLCFRDLFVVALLPHVLKLGSRRIGIREKDGTTLGKI